MIKVIKKDTYTLILSDCPCEVFTYYGVKEMHGLNTKDCAAYNNNADQAYFAGWANYAPKENGEYQDYDARFIFINISRCTDPISTMGLIMHETMHHSFWLHNYNVHKEEEIITWAEEEAYQIAKLMPAKEQTNEERLDEFTEKTRGLCDAKPPYVSDDFQIGPDGAYELGCSYPDCICQGNEIAECKNRVYPELQGTLSLCNDITEKRTGKMIEEEWQAAERAQTTKTK